MKRKIPLILAILTLNLIIAALSQAQYPVIQISTEIDAESGKAVNWQDLTVIWEEDDLTIEQIPDHLPIDYDSSQEWYAPISPIIWRKFTFIRTIPGVYFLRYGDGEIFSIVASVMIMQPPSPIHND